MITITVAKIVNTFETYKISFCFYIFLTTFYSSLIAWKKRNLCEVCLPIAKGRKRKFFRCFIFLLRRFVKSFAAGKKKRACE